MSELIQVKKQVTFEELCPKWSEAIRKGHISDNLGYLFHQCIVGEAYSFKHNGYNGCQICEAYAYRLVCSGGRAAISIIADTLLFIDHELFEREKSWFMRHWNKCHVGGET